MSFTKRALGSTGPRPYPGQTCQVRRPAGSESGSILVLTVVMMTMLLGFTALAIDGSNAYDQRNRLAAAADAAAKGAAQELLRNSSADLQTFAEKEVTLNGFTPGATMTVTVNHPPQSGAFSGNTKYVEVIASQQTPTFFAGLLGFASLTPSARAAAGGGPGPNCMVALATTATALSVGGGASLGQAGCAIVANSNMTVGNNSNVTASPVSLTGTCSGSSCPNGVQTGTGLTVDPLASLAAPTNPGGCTALVLGNNTTGTATAGCYSSITVGGGTKLTFGAGNYYVTGDITFGANSTVVGPGVSIFLTGAASAFTLGGASTLKMTAPTTGTYAGILFFQDRADTMTWAFNNNATVFAAGAIYVPSGTLSLGGASSITNTDCSVIVAKNVTLNNNSATTLKNTCAAFGGSPLKSVGVAE